MAYIVHLDERILIKKCSEDTEQMMKFEAYKTLKAIEDWNVEVKEGDYVDLDYCGRFNETYSESTKPLMKRDAHKTLKDIENWAVDVKEGDYVAYDHYGRGTYNLHNEATKICVGEPRTKVRFVKLKSVKRKVSVLVKKIIERQRAIIERVERDKELDSEAAASNAVEIVPLESVAGKKTMKSSAFAAEVYENQEDVAVPGLVSSITSTTRLNIANRKRCGSDICNVLEDCNPDQLKTENGDKPVVHKGVDPSGEVYPSLEYQKSIYQTVPEQTFRNPTSSCMKNANVNAFTALGMKTIWSREHSEDNTSYADCLSSVDTEGNCDETGSSIKHDTHERPCVKGDSTLADVEARKTEEHVLESHHANELLEVSHSHSMLLDDIRSCSLNDAKLDKIVEQTPQTSDDDTSSNVSNTISSASHQSGSCKDTEGEKSSSCSTKVWSNMNATFDTDELRTGRAHKSEATFRRNLFRSHRPNIQDLEHTTPSPTGSQKHLQALKVNCDHSANEAVTQTATGSEYGVLCDAMDKQTFSTEIVDDYVTACVNLCGDNDFVLNEDSDSDSDESYHTCIDYIYQANDRIASN